jgi:hypothetical protein
MEGTRRQLRFCRIFEKGTPNVAISHGSVDLCRVAFGLGIPIVTTVDAPHAEAVNRLTLPLSDYVVASMAIPRERLQAYNPKGKIISFDGVDEVAWIKDFKPKIKYSFGKPLIVVRQFEEKAAYAREERGLLSLARKLAHLGTVVFLSRYNRKAVKGLVVPKEFVDSASLVAQADLFLGSGGTITREAALQGTPAVIVNPFPNQYVNDFLAEKGFPIFKTDKSEALKLAQKLLGRKRNVKELLAKLENPVDIIERIVKEKIREN